MAGKIAARLKELGITLPAPPAPAGNYLPYVRAGNILFLSGQGCVLDGKPAYTGKIGRTCSVEDGVKAARVAALNVLSRVSVALDGDLDRVRGITKVVGFMNVEPGIKEMPRVLDGASNLFVEIFGDTAKHARAAIGIAALPYDMPIAVDVTFVVE